MCSIEPLFVVGTRINWTAFSEIIKREYGNMDNEKSVKDELAQQLYGVESVVKDSLYDELVSDEMPKNQTLEEHDRRHHKGHFDPSTQTCRFREELSVETETDKADELDSDIEGENGEEGEISNNGIEKLSTLEMGKLGDLFGKTDDVSDVGWILPDGSMIDLKKGGDKRDRVEHSDVGKALCEMRGVDIGDKSLDFVDYLRRSGAIRVSRFEGNCFLDVYTKPTEEQFDRLHDISRHTWQDGNNKQIGHGVELGNGEYLTYESDSDLRRRLVNDVKREFLDHNDEFEESFYAEVYPERRKSYSSEFGEDDGEALDKYEETFTNDGKYRMPFRDGKFSKEIMDKVRRGGDSDV